MISESQAESAAHYLIENSSNAASAKANRIYLEEFRKSKLALLYQKAPPGSVADRENFARAHPEYLAVLDGLKEAVEEEEQMRWQMIAAQTRIELYRTQSANERKF